MNWWRRLRHQGRLERELDAELRDHLARQIADYVAAGMPEADARRRATLEFGGLDQVKETCRDARGLRAIGDAAHDARYALRMLRRHPGFTCIAVLALGLGIGANAAVFTLVNGLLFRTPAVHEPERLVFVSNCTGNIGAIDRLRQQHHLFEQVGGWMATQFSLGAGGRAEWVDGLLVTPGYFETLGVRAAAGRLPPEAARRTVVISDALWRRRFGAAPDAVGRSLAINHVPYRIAGITPRHFTGLDVGRTFDVIAPLLADPAQDGCGPLSVVARLAPGQTIETAAEALRGAADRPIALQPAARGRSDLRSRYERPLLTIMAVAGLVLLIACVTIANLVLARATARVRELGIRLALGASRSRLVRQILVESAVLAAAGAAAGLVVAWWGGRAIVDELSAESILATGRTIFGSAHLFLDVSFDSHVLAFTGAITLITALLFGLMPATRASRAASLAGARTIAPSPARVPGPAQGLVVAQVALSCVLIVAAGLFVRSLDSLVDVPLGFEPSRMIVVDITTPPSTLAAPRMRLFERAREEVQRVPGVSDATLSVSAPMTGWDLLVEVEAGHPSTSRVETGVNDSLANIVSPGWFRALGTPLVDGRDFTEADGPQSPAVVVVNEAFARQFLDGESPLGQTITIRGMGPDTPPRTIVGIAGDALWSLRDPVPPILYVPLAQADQDALELRVQEQGLTLGVRASGETTTELTTRIVEAVARVDPALSLTFRSPAAHITASLTQERVTAILSGFFGMLALVLAAVALYGVTGYAVSCRRAEIGIRLALGGTPMAVARLVLGPLWRLVGIGVAAGALASLLLAPLVSGLLYGVGPRDTLTLSAAAMVLSVVAGLAAWIPAYRAARINPVAVLRAE